MPIGITQLIAGIRLDGFWPLWLIGVVFVIGAVVILLGYLSGVTTRLPLRIGPRQGKCRIR